VVKIQLQGTISEIEPRNNFLLIFHNTAFKTATPSHNALLFLT